LLNRLCGTSLVSQNQLFASLHTFMRKYDASYLEAGCT
jgi:50S ribosomal subunit-associated GTPase HflX